MKPLVLLSVLSTAVLLSACSSITEGTSQSIAISTDPSGANCALVRQGLVIGRVNPTPGAVTVDKTKHDITIECSKAGFQTAQYHNKSDVAGMTAGNIIAGGVVGWAIDSATGADNKYTGSVHLQLVPDGAPAPTPASASGTAPTS